jgi:hypothetical protein
MSVIKTHYRDPNRGFRLWRRDEIVTEDGDGQWVPNPQDLVFDPIQGFMLVTEVDYTTGLSVLTPWDMPDRDEDNDDVNVLIGSGPGYVSESYRLFLDQSVTPHTLSPDSRLRFYGSMVDHYKVFLGTDINEENGKVVSTFYDGNGNFLGTSIPLESVTVPGAEQDVIKSPMTGYTVEAMEDGELCTLVAYANDGTVVSIAQLLVKNTQVIRHPDTARKYVAAISIDTPFISSVDPQTIEFPLNVTVESLPMTALVHYSDGSKHRLPIDNNKFSLYGLNNYVATVVGQEFPMVLAYNLADDEVSYNLEPTANRRLTMSYRAKTAARDGAYEVKLFVYPIWQDSERGYRLEYWLYNLDRQTFYNVTPYVQMGVNSKPFRSTEYGVLQTLTVAVDLNKVDGRFAPYRHVQTFQIALMARGDEATPNWVVYFRPDQQKGYGQGLIADVEYVNTNYWNLYLDNGRPSKEVWLKDLYYAIEPLVNEETEVLPPEPTHFRVKFLHNSWEFSVEQWNEALYVINDLERGDVVYLEWIRRTYDSDLQLGISALPVVIREGLPQ